MHRIVLFDREGAHAFRETRRQKRDTYTELLSGDCEMNANPYIDVG